MALHLHQGKTKEELIHDLATVCTRADSEVTGNGHGAEIASLLSHPDLDVVAAALEALGSLGAEEGAWFAHVVAIHLGTNSVKVRCAAVGALGLFGKTSSAYIQGVAKLTSDQPEAVRAASIVALGQIGAEEELECITRALEDCSPVVVCAACQALGLMPDVDDDHIASIARKLDNPETRYAAVTSLADLGERATSRHVEHILKTCLYDKDGMTRQMAVSAVGQAADALPLPPHCMEMLLGGLKSAEVGVRCTAALTFGQLGEQGGLAHCEEVAALLGDNSEDLSEMHLQIGGVLAGSPPTLRRPKCAALAALGMMRAEGMAEACAAELGNECCEVRLCALDCLMNLGDAGQAQSSLIAGCFEDNTVFVRVKACEAIGALNAEDAMTELVDLFDDKSPSVRIAALYALAESPKVVESFSNEVLKCLSDPVPSVKAAAITVLGNLAEMGHAYASSIAAVLEEEEEDWLQVRCAACEALSKLGDYGAAFEDELARLEAQAAEPELRASAAEALDRLRTPRLEDLSYYTGRPALGDTE